MIPWLGENDAFPPVSRALAEPNGLLAAGGDLSPGRLLSAYSQAIFPWFSPGQPILWWSPDPRMVFVPGTVRVRRSFAKVLRNRPFTVSADTAFRTVIEACAAPRDADGGTWITAEMVDAYVRLHDLGHAHSIEVWMDGALAGGLYGVALGRMFFGESMFSRRPDASKIALAHLDWQLADWGFGLIDCQMHTDHLASMGGVEMARAAFARRVGELIECPGRAGRWRLDDGLLGRHLSAPDRA